jgi:hypothetical protein
MNWKQVVPWDQLWKMVCDGQSLFNSCMSIANCLGVDWKWFSDGSALGRSLVWS